MLEQVFNFLKFERIGFKEALILLSIVAFFITGFCINVGISHYVNVLLMFCSAINVFKILYPNGDTFCLVLYYFLVFFLDVIALGCCYHSYGENKEKFKVPLIILHLATTALVVIQAIHKGMTCCSK